MKQRCSNPKNKQYMDYGGRGISYPEKWKSFEEFEEDMSSGYLKGLTIDRIDNNKNYSIENCKWSTRKEQNNNKRSNIIIDYAGQSKTLLEWWKYLNMEISYDTLRSRYYNGMKVENMLEMSTLYRPWKLNKTK